MFFYYQPKCSIKCWTAQNDTKEQMYNKMFVPPRKKKRKKQNKESTGRLVVWWMLCLISRHQRGSSMQTNSRLSRFTVQATCIQCHVLPKLIRFMTDGALQSHCGIWKQAAFQQFSYLGFMCTSFSSVQSSNFFWEESMTLKMKLRNRWMWNLKLISAWIPLLYLPVWKYLCSYFSCGSSCKPSSRYSTDGFHSK